MSIVHRAKAEVPVTCRTSGIHWLVIESDATSGGWFLFGHRSLDEPSDFDSWYRMREEAIQEASARWGVARDAWRVEPT
jgi:hypothetical protein